MSVGGVGRIFKRLKLTLLSGQKRAQDEPRHRAIPDVRSRTRTVQIVRFPVVLQKIPRTLSKSTRSPASSLRKFYEKTLNFSQNQPTVHFPVPPLLSSDPRQTTRCGGHRTARGRSPPSSLSARARWPRCPLTLSLSFPIHHPAHRPWIGPPRQARRRGIVTEPSS